MAVYLIGTITYLRFVIPFYIFVFEYCGRRWPFVLMIAAGVFEL